jgi:hypothetical protein
MCEIIELSIVPAGRSIAGATISSHWLVKLQIRATFYLCRAPHSVVPFLVMERPMLSRSHDRRRLLAAVACLLATAFLYAPLVRLAWAAHVMDCCTGDYCPIAQHHHHKSSAPDADCGRDMDAVSACSMSCCQTDERAVTTALVFVLPLPAPVSEPVMVARATRVDSSAELRLPLTPLSPPPRAA